MRIGVMLRAVDERQGIGIYSKHVMDELLALDTTNRYVLFYADRTHSGDYADFPHVEAQYVAAPSKAIWDQVCIPLAARRHGVDVIFHTKFTVPFAFAGKTVMTAHGASWFVKPELYGKLDVAYIRTFMPLYCRKATAIIANSELTRQDYIRFLKVPPEKIFTVPLGTSAAFRPIRDPAVLADVRKRFDLPERFMLSVIKHDPRKNFKNLIAAFRLLRKRVPAKLVVTGIGCEQYREEYAMDSDGISADVTFLGWVDQADLPALYSLAVCKFFPSVYEEFGIPTCEAMACGCPPVVSNTGALPEIAGDAGLLVDPFNPRDMADALERLWTDEGLRARLSERSLERAAFYTWQRCAEQTLAVLNGLRENEA